MKTYAKIVGKEIKNSFYKVSFYEIDGLHAVLGMKPSYNPRLDPNSKEYRIKKDAFLRLVTAGNDRLKADQEITEAESEITELLRNNLPEVFADYSRVTTDRAEELARHLLFEKRHYMLLSCRFIEMP